MAKMQFNPDDHEERDPPNFDAIPAGEYRAVIVETEMKPTRSGDGQYLNLQFQVDGGTEDGRYFWDRLNIYNKNPKAEEIARGTLSKICRIMGIDTLNDSDELLGKPIMVKLSVRSYEWHGEARQDNVVKAYSACPQVMSPKPQDPVADIDPETGDEIPF